MRARVRLGVFSINDVIVTELWFTSLVRVLLPGSSLGTTVTLTQAKRLSGTVSSLAYVSTFIQERRTVAQWHLLTNYYR